MGYDISVRFGTIEEKKEMHDFILENMHFLERLEKTDPTPFSIVLVIDDDIGTYAPKKERDKLFSFHGTGIPSYAWKLCCWMSHRSTYRNRKGNSVVIYRTFDAESHVLQGGEEVKTTSKSMSS